MEERRKFPTRLSAGRKQSVCYHIAMSQISSNCEPCIIGGKIKNIREKSTKKKYNESVLSKFEMYIEFLFILLRIWDIKKTKNVLV